MRAVNDLTELGASVQHVVTTEYGYFFGLDVKGRALIKWDGCTYEIPVPRHLVAEVEVSW